MFPEPFESKLQNVAFLPLNTLFPKNKDILLDKHSTII